MNNPPKILVVDDIPIDVLLLSKVLRQEGYHVLSAENGTSAYSIATSQNPDLILLDVMMPGQDGYGVCQSLMENSVTAETPVIFVTAKTKTVDKIRGLNVGGVDYITKPYKPAEVVARIHTHLRMRAINEENLEYQKAILRSQKAASVSTLAGGVAHNINNLMGAVIGYTDMLRSTLEHDQEAYRYTDKVLEASQRAADLANDLLMYTKVGRGTMSSVNVRELLEKMLKLYSGKELGESRVEMTIPEDIPEIQANSDQLLHALSNIFMNSLEAAPNGDIAISVSTGTPPSNVHCNGSESAAQTYAVISISDTGPGMDEETIERIFEPFFTTKQTVGVGLGLSATCGIIKKHKGAIAVDSNQGEGSTFHIYLPAEVISDR